MIGYNIIFVQIAVLITGLVINLLTLFSFINRRKNNKYYMSLSKEELNRKCKNIKIILFVIPLFFIDLLYSLFIRHYYIYLIQTLHVLISILLLFFIEYIIIIGYLSSVSEEIEVNKEIWK